MASLNLVQRLRARELGGLGRSRPSSPRKFYENVCPNHTLYDVESPKCIIKKFTRDGKYLICFSYNQHALQVYKFNGPSGPVGSPSRVIERTTADTFAYFFTLAYESILVSEQEVLCKDFCLFTESDTHVILASTKHPSAPDGRQAGMSTVLYDYTFFLVDLATGVPTDKRTFRRDSINLSNQSSVHLYRNLFGVLSLNQQKVHLFQIKGNNTFVDLHVIGENCFEDDALALAQFREFDLKSLSSEGAAFPRPPCDDEEEPMDWSEGDLWSLAHAPLRTDYAPMRDSFDVDGVPHANSTPSLSDNDGHGPEAIPAGMHVPSVQLPSPSRRASTGAPFLSGLQHRLLAFLFRQAQSAGQAALQKFYSHFGQYESLVMWRFQFLNETHLLVKFGCMDGVLGKMSEYSQHTSLFVVYSLATTAVINVFENSSEILLALYEQHAEFFHMGGNVGESSYLTFSSNNQHARENLHKQKYAVSHAKNGGYAHAVKRLLWALPCSAQSLSQSPYFDHSLFNFDEKLISPSDRAKPCAEYPIKFHSRSHKGVRFKIDPNVASRPPSRMKRYATYVFHPVLPFFISIQYATLQPAAINFHYRSSVGEEL